MPEPIVAAEKSEGNSAGGGLQDGEAINKTDDAVAKRATEAVQEHGGCGAVSTDGKRVCIKDAERCPPHGWEGDLSVQL